MKKLALLIGSIGLFMICFGLGWIIGEQAVWDIKTYTTATKKNRKKCYEQLKMYSEAIEYLTGTKITNKYLIHLPKNKGIRIYDLKEEFENVLQDDENN